MYVNFGLEFRDINDDMYSGKSYSCITKQHQTLIMVMFQAKENAMDLVCCGMLFTSFRDNIKIVTEYPANCTMYYGPHSTDCLVTIWLGAKCLREGYKYPHNLTSSEHENLDAMNLRYDVIDFF